MAQIGFIPERMQTEISSPASNGGNSPIAADELSVSAGPSPQVRYYQRNREKIRERNKRYRQTPQRRAWQRAYNKQYKRRPFTPEQRLRMNQQSKAWQANNRAQVRIIQKRFRSTPTFKAKNAAKVRAWRARPENKLKAAAWSKRWRENNKLRIQALHMKRRAVIAKVTVGSHSVEGFVKRVRSKHRVKCYYCNRSISGAVAHIDHVLALHLGGAHAVENLCVSCPNCNLKKGPKPLSDLQFLKQQLLYL